MVALWSERLGRLQYGLLCALAVVLPILEAPKNIVLALLVLVWGAQRLLSRATMRWQADPLEISLLLLVGASLLSTVVNWPFSNGTKGLRDISMQAFVCWIIYRSTYQEPHRQRLVAMIALGVLIGLVWGVADVIAGNATQLQFHSAGIVTQSAIYLGIAMMAGLAMAWHQNFTEPGRTRILGPLWWWSLTLVMTIGLFLMGSRGAIAGVLVTGLLYALVIADRRFWVALSVVFAVGIAVALLLPNQFAQRRALTKTLEPVAAGQIASADQERVDNWRIAVAQVALGNSLLVGVGPRNFGAIDVNDMRFNPPLTINPAKLNHAHNLFLTKMAEEGALGLAAMLIFFGVVVQRLVRSGRSSPQRGWAWYSAWAALLVPIIAGSFNTPWYQEHAKLAMMLIALFLQSNRGAGPGNKPSAAANHRY